MLSCFKIMFFACICMSIGYITKAQTKPIPNNPFKKIDAEMLLIPASNTASTSSIAAFIKQKFNKEGDQLRAAFIWIANNITYDIDNMFAINLYETKEDKLKKSLVTRKGICEHFAILFTDICTQLKIESYTIEGYTKQNGFTDYIPHAWSAAKIDNAWYLFDPTWGSGYIYNKKFVKKINNEFYKVSPKKLIKSHMPFDYMWQFLEYPITTAEFYENKINASNTKPYFNYNDSISAYNNASLQKQLEGYGYKD